MKKEVLDFKPVPRLEQVGDMRSKQVDDHKHRIRFCIVSDDVLILSYRANPAGWNSRESQGLRRFDPTFPI